MRNYVEGINPQLLVWAREKAGLTVEDVAAALKTDVSRVSEWEKGHELPTYPQLERLADQVYKRPIAIFFFPDPPEEIEPVQAFRTVPEIEIRSLWPDTRYGIREARARQLALYELTDGVNPSGVKLFEDVHLDEESPVVASARRVREYLELPLPRQISWRSTTEALKSWREAIQATGIFVFKRSFRERDFLGLSLLDPVFPIIYLNNSTVQPRQIFTLLHELAHVLVGANGITKMDDSYVRRLTGHTKALEVFCNQFAAELLIPVEDFSTFRGEDFYDDSLIEELAKRYKASREAILRRALDLRLVDKDHYAEKAAEWARQAQAVKRAPGGDYYATTASYLGTPFIELVFRNYYRGRCSRQDAADYLDISEKSLSGIEAFAYSGEVEA